MISDQFNMSFESVELDEMREIGAMVEVIEEGGGDEGTSQGKYFLFFVNFLTNHKS